jgi:anti-sigma factor RsiW
MSITDETLMAYVDGELSESGRLKVESAVAADPALRERLERHRRFRARMGGAFAGVLDEPAPERLVAAARPSSAVSLAQRRPRPPLPWIAMAASLAVGVIAGSSIPRFQRPAIGSDMVAHGQLAHALEKQLASSPGKDEVVRVGLTFRSAGGYCRTFTERRVAGLACREGDSWKVRMAVAQAAGPGGEYRTAASETPAAILDAAQALMVGEPLDGKAEAAAQAKGWR